MIIYSDYKSFSPPVTTPNVKLRQEISAKPAIGSDVTVTLSEESKQRFEIYQKTDEEKIEEKLEAIKRKGPLERTTDEMEYLFTHDKTLSAIRKKNESGIPLKSSEVDYEQKAIGFLNTMAALTPDEQKLYDEIVASGDEHARVGLMHVAFLRATGGLVAGADGVLYDANKTAITSENIAKYFSHSIVDDTGAVSAQFNALSRYLERRTENA